MEEVFFGFPATLGLQQLTEAERLGHGPGSLAALARATAALGLARGWTLPTAGYADALAEIGWERLEAGREAEARRAFDHALAGRQLCVRARLGLARISARGTSP